MVMMAICAHVSFISRDYEKMGLQIVSQPVKLLCNLYVHEICQKESNFDNVNIK
jgi:hypothetical protein